MRRYGSDFDPPGPRLREYVLAVKQIFESFRTGAPLAVEGEFYALSLLPPMWAPGPIDVAGPAHRRRRGQPLDAPHGRAGGRRRPRAPAEPRDLPARDGAARTGGGRRPLGRSVDDLEVIVPAFLCVGDTEEEQHAWREMARVQIAFYGSTPNYAFIFEQLDREGTTERIRERQRAGDVAGMAAVIDDDLLEQFTTTGTWDDIADAIVAKYGGMATRVVSYFTGSDVVRSPEAFERWGELARGSPPLD